MGVPPGLVLIAALAATGCLSAPQEEEDEGSDAGEPSCQPIVVESFEDPLDEQLWDADTSSSGSVESSEGSIVLTSPPDEVGAFAQLEYRVPVSLANTVLTATFSASTTGFGNVYFNLKFTEDEEMSFYVQEGHLLAEYEVGGDDENLCVPCPVYDGDLVTVRMTSDDSRAIFEWGDDDNLQQFATSQALLSGAALLQIETFAMGTDTAAVTVEEISWSDCAP